MSGSLSGTLDVGIGRGSLTGTIAPSQGCIFSAYGEQVLNFGINGGPVGGTTGIQITSEGEIYPTVICGFDLYSGPPGTMTCDVSVFGGTLTAGNPNYIVQGGTEFGSVYPISVTGTLFRTYVENDQAYGRAIIATPNGNCTWDNVPMGPSGGNSDFATMTIGQTLGYLIINGDFESYAGPLATVTLNPLSPTIFEPLALSGNEYINAITNLEYQVDQAGDWLPVTDYEGSWSWTGAGPEAIAGAHILQVRDGDNPTVVSNYQGYFLNAITLNLIGAEPNVPPAIGGYDYESSVASALQLQINGPNSDWLDVASFTPASAPDDPWTGIGAPEPPGTYTAQVRNAAVPSTVSNVVTYVIGQNGGTYEDLPVWSVQPDWRNGVLERMDWLTAIMTSDSGAEQRLAQRVTPRRTFSYPFVIFNQERALFDLALKAQGTSDWYVPNWTDITRLLEILSTEDTVIEIPTAGHQYAPGSLLILYGDPFTYEICIVESLDSNSLTLTAAPLTTWPFGTRVMPLLRCQLAQEPTSARNADRALVGTVGWITNQSNSFLASTEGMDTFGGWPVLTVQPDETAALNYKFERIRYDLDPGFGLRDIADTAGFGFGSQQYAWFVIGYSSQAVLRSLFYTLKGKQSPLWVPSFFCDLFLVDDIGPSDTSITVKQCGYTLFNCSQLSGRQNICIQLFDGTRYYATITGSALAIPNEVLQLAAPFDVEIAEEDVLRISFMAFCRQDSDQIEFDHKAAGGVVTATTVFREAPDLRQLTYQILDPAKATGGKISQSGQYFRATQPNQIIIAKSVAGLTSGKHWIEASITAPGEAQGGFGVTTLAATEADVQNSGTNSAILIATEQGPAVFINGTFITNLAGFDTVPPYYGVAVDLDLNLVWFVTQYDAATIEYNGNPSADPVLGVGGFDISWRGSNAMFAVVKLDPSSTSASAVVNAGQILPYIPAPNGFEASWQSI